jgi:hypothetical protein
MAIILPQGSTNPSAFNAPGVYIAEQLPTQPIEGVASDVILVVGTAIGGPVNKAVSVFGLNEAIATFGTPQNAPYDLVTQIMGASSAGAGSFIAIRVTDDTDVKADVDILDVTSPSAVNGMTITAKNSGTLANGMKVYIAPGTNSTNTTPTFKVTIVYPINNNNSPVPEVFDNIGGSGATLWQNMVNAINAGQGQLVPASKLVTAAIGTATASPAIASYTLSGGTTGNSGVTQSDLVGSNTAPLTGMYAASGSKFSYMILANVSDDTTYAAQQLFAYANGAYAMLTRPYNESYTDAIAAKKTVALDSTAAKLLVGDWCYIQDPYNNVQRYISTQSFAASVFAQINPEQSGLNKQITSPILLGTYSTINNITYSNGDIGAIRLNGLDVIYKPSPGGNYFALQTGKNTSSNVLANTDSYTKNTNFIALSIAAAVGPYIGQLQSPSEIQSITTAVKSFLRGLWVEQKIGYTGDPNRVPYVVTVNTSQATNGVQILQVQVAFLAVVEILLINLQTGVQSIQSVSPQ